MLQQMKQSSIASALHASNVRVVDPAELPDAPGFAELQAQFRPGLFSGLFLGIALVIMRERADRTLQQPGEIKLWTDLPELGTIPSASVDGEKILANATPTPFSSHRPPATRMLAAQKPQSPRLRRADDLGAQAEPHGRSLPLRSHLHSVCRRERQPSPRPVFTSATARTAKPRSSAISASPWPKFAAKS